MAQTPHHENQAPIMKGKRTKRLRTPSVSPSSTVDCSTSSAGPTHEQEQDQDLANSLILLAQGKTGDSSPVFLRRNSLFLYHCKTCDRCFPSFQALGGHTATHKKPKFLHPSRLSSPLSTGRTVAAAAVKSKVHRCLVCGTEFSSGQALGGHMRRHRPLPPSPTPQLQEFMIDKKRNVLEFDLNLPAPEEDRHRTAASSALVHCPY